MSAHEPDSIFHWQHPDLRHNEAVPLPSRAVAGFRRHARPLPTPVPGALLYFVEIGDWVSEGQRLALVVPDVGVEHDELLAPFEGLVMTRRDRRLARRGEYIIKVLRNPRPEADPEMGR
jgi:uncharacterized protein